MTPTKETNQTSDPSDGVVDASRSWWRSVVIFAIVATLIAIDIVYDLLEHADLGHILLELIIALLAVTGVVPTAASGAVLPIDLETTSVVVLAFPPMLLLWKAIQDDGQVNIVETAAMICVFGIVVFLLAVHG